ncbi:putative small auxin-up RNA [Medicago truncatula]|uniref:Putative small auxin-up RNA n=1 Tax=Medicago truncatula TaxID=3880 RepID=A0A396HE58_MEDTR|nr:putative small auxin-up RNA [Medicago truncatula]
MMFSKSYKQVHHHGGRRATKFYSTCELPLFLHLLKEAEEEYGFSHQGTITIPCQLLEFKDILQHIMIHIHNYKSQLQYQHHLNLVGCFRASSL